MKISTLITGTAHYETNPSGIDPFTIGDLDPDKGFVHVLDDTTLDIILRTLDTITDFAEYLTKKEALMRSGRAIMAAGEEDLLAFYLSNVDENEQHDFMVPPDLKGVFIEEGHWVDFTRSPQRQAQLVANEVSYAWDRLIETFGTHTIGGTQYYRSHESVGENEWSIRLLAREPRTRRRMLATKLLEVVGEEVPQGYKRSRHLLPSRPGDPYYVFLLLWRSEEQSYEDFREYRRDLLVAYCMVLKALYPEAEDIVGLATEDRTAVGRSEDVFYLDARQWSEEDQSEALRLQEEFNILRKHTRSDTQAQEYPEIQNQPRGSSRRTTRSMRGRDRNKPCPCGSDKKVKKCCGSTTARL